MFTVEGAYITLLPATLTIRPQESYFGVGLCVDLKKQNH